MPMTERVARFRPADFITAMYEWYGLQIRLNKSRDGLTLVPGNVPEELKALIRVHKPALVTFLLGN